VQPRGRSTDGARVIHSDNPAACFGRTHNRWDASTEPHGAFRPVEDGPTRTPLRLVTAGAGGRPSRPVTEGGSG
jgi:hypothetical protein